MKIQLSLRTWERAALEVNQHYIVAVASGIIGVSSECYESPQEQPATKLSVLGEDGGKGNGVQETAELSSKGWVGEWSGVVVWGVGDKLSFSDFYCEPEVVDGEGGFMKSESVRKMPSEDLKVAQI